MSDGAVVGDGEGNLLSALIAALPDIAEHHARSGPLHALLSRVASVEAARLFGEGAACRAEIAPFGTVVFPHHVMGAVSSLDLFGLDELIMFAYYHTGRARYRRVADLGANIGLHSIILDRCGYEVRAFEPDPAHFERLAQNLAENDATHVRAENAAVSVEAGEAEFVRVLGNTTGSHLAGAKANPYGPLERFTVPLLGIAPILAWADLLKIDVEGHERDLLCATRGGQWEGTDALVEVGTAENAAALFEHFTREGVGLFAQKVGWRRVTRVEEVPTSYREGTLFISRREAMPWTD